jgi:hypothetical protein
MKRSRSARRREALKGTRRRYTSREPRYTDDRSVEAPAPRPAEFARAADRGTMADADPEAPAPACGYQAAVVVYAARQYGKQALAVAANPDSEALALLKGRLTRAGYALVAVPPLPLGEWAELDTPWGVLHRAERLLAQSEGRTDEQRTDA